MASRHATGLRQEYPPFGTYSACKVVPADVRGVNGLPRELRRSLQTNDYLLAVRRLADVMTEFQAKIDAARAGSGSPLVTLAGVLSGIRVWRFKRAAELTGISEGFADGPDGFEYLVDEGGLDGLKDDALRFFEVFPDQERGLARPTHVALLLARLDGAARTPSGWTAIPGFDAALDAAIADVGAELPPGTRRFGMADVVPLGRPVPPQPPQDGFGLPIPIWLREQARQPFADAWLEVARLQEWRRARAAHILHVAALSSAGPQALASAPEPSPTYTPRSDDRTLAELATAFKGARGANVHRYAHVFAAIEEVVGGAKPVRAITRADLKAAIAYMRRIPTNYRKRWPGLTLAEAVQKADTEGLGDRLSSGSVDTYVAHMRSMFAWAHDEEWLDESPTRDLKVTSAPAVKRRAFTTAELSCVFGALAAFRTVQPERWWVPALAAYTGARLNELCQLRVDEVEEVEGVWVLNLSEFGSDGRRVGDKSLKTAASERFVPIHPAVAQAGFLDYVKGQRQAGAERLFDRLKPGPNGGWSHEFSKWWGRFLDKLDVTDPGATFHSFRHGWREQAALAGLSDRQIDAIGGWAAKGQAARYGRRTVVQELAPLMDRIEFGGFGLPDVY